MQQRRPLTYKEWAERRTTTWNLWKPGCGGILNIQHINPKKHYIVKDIVSIAKSYKEIVSIYIFGSSINTACTDKSDIDILIKLKQQYQNDKVLKNNINNDIAAKVLYCDIFFINDLNPNTNFYKTIMKRKVEVYHSV